MIKFNQNTRLKPYIDKNSDLRKKAKEDFEKDFFKFINAKKCRDIKLFTTDRRRNYWVSEPNYHTSKPFTEHLLAIEMKNQTKILINKPVYLGLSIL